MKKIPCLIVSDYANNVPTLNIHRDCNWVFDGGDEVVATIKWDGESAMYKDGIPWRRLGARLNKKYLNSLRLGEVEFNLSMLDKNPKDGLPCNDVPDLVTGHFPFWIPCSFDNPSDKYHIEAFNNLDSDKLNNMNDGDTFELVGNKVNGNRHNLNSHIYVRHGDDIVDVDRDIKSIFDWLVDNNAEGLVFHNKLTGDMCKIRRLDFTRSCTEEDLVGVDKRLIRKSKSNTSGVVNFSDFKSWNNLDFSDFAHYLFD